MYTYKYTIIQSRIKVYFTYVYRFLSAPSPPPPFSLSLSPHSICMLYFFPSNLPVCLSE